MTAQYDDVQHETPAAEQNAAPHRTTPRSTLRKLGAWSVALAGVAGASAMAVAVMTPNCLPWTCGG
ncbi:MAG TPA: hypothetical protein VGL05_27440 [Kribbella sp.]